MRRATPSFAPTFAPSFALETLEERRLLDSALPHEAYFPEGFSNAAIYQAVPIANTNAAPAQFELWARYETGERDELIRTGTLAPGASDEVILSNPAAPSANPLRADTPYALVLKSSQPLAAQLIHKDFGRLLGSAFSRETSDDWSFAEVEKNDTSRRDFIVFYNPQPTAVRVTLTFVNAAGQTFSISADWGPQRRGGWAVNDLPALATGFYSARLSASAPVIASQSSYGLGTINRGFASLGDSTAGSTSGVLPTILFRERYDDDRPSTDNPGSVDDDGTPDQGPGDRFTARRGSTDDDGTADQGSGDAPGTSPSGGSTDDDGTADQGSGDAPGTSPSGGSDDRNPDGSRRDGLLDGRLSIFNPGSTPATITLRFVSDDDSHPPITRTVQAPGGRRTSVSLAALNVSDDYISGTWTSTAPVTISAAVDGSIAGTGYSSSSSAASRWDYSSGRMDRSRAGHGLLEDIHVFNPNLTNVTITIDLFFAGGGSSQPQSIRITFDLAGRKSEKLALHLVQAILNRGDDVRYAFRVNASSPVVTAFERWDDRLGGGYTTQGTPGGTIIALNQISS